MRIRDTRCTGCDEKGTTWQYNNYLTLLGSLHGAWGKIRARDTEQNKSTNNNLERESE